MSYFVTNDRGKNQYERLDEVHARSTLRSIISLMVVGLCAIFLITTAWNFNNSMYQTINTHIVYLNSRRLPLNVVSDKFLSFGLDTSLLRDMNNLPILNEKFINLARHLAPAYVRVGGTSADCLYFNQTEPTMMFTERIISPIDGQDISNFSITDMDFTHLYQFATEANLRMIFDINVLIRNADNAWNDANAKNIISFARNANMKLDWQLGNEPNSFHHVFNVTVTATQLAEDYYHLRKLLNEAGYDESILVGPEVNHVGDVNHQGELYAKVFLQNDKDSVNYITWHQYYLNGREARVEDFVNASTFNYLPEQIKSMKEILETSGKSISMWLSETSTAFGGGAPELSDRFVAGFLWLDKLGYSASTGLNVVTRQSFFGGNYAMVGSDIMPNPDWWVSVIYKQFVSEKVLKLTAPDDTGHLRLYAHCTPDKMLISRVSAITIYGVNINPFPVRVIVQGMFSVLERSAKIFLYALTSDNLTSRLIKMNGKILKLQPNGDLPPFRPVILEATQPITLPAYSMVFLVIHGAKVPACNT